MTSHYFHPALGAVPVANDDWRPGATPMRLGRLTASYRKRVANRDASKPAPVEYDSRAVMMLAAYETMNEKQLRRAVVLLRKQYYDSKGSAGHKAAYQAAWALYDERYPKRAVRLIRRIRAGGAK